MSLKDFLNEERARHLLPLLRVDPSDVLTAAITASYSDLKRMTPDELTEVIELVTCYGMHLRDCLGQNRASMVAMEKKLGRKWTDERIKAEMMIQQLTPVVYGIDQKIKSLASILKLKTQEHYGR